MIDYGNRTDYECEGLRFGSEGKTSRIIEYKNIRLVNNGYGTEVYDNSGFRVKITPFVFKDKPALEQLFESAYNGRYDKHNVSKLNSEYICSQAVCKETEVDGKPVFVAERFGIKMQVSIGKDGLRVKVPKGLNSAGKPLDSSYELRFFDELPDIFKGSLEFRKGFGSFCKKHVNDFDNYVEHVIESRLGVAELRQAWLGKTEEKSKLEKGFLYRLGSFAVKHLPDFLCPDFVKRYVSGIDASIGDLSDGIAKLDKQIAEAEKNKYARGEGMSRLTGISQSLKGLSAYMDSCNGRYEYIQPSLLCGGSIGAIFDGDTVVFKGRQLMPSTVGRDGDSRSIADGECMDVVLRLSDIDAPERYQSGGLESQQTLASIIDRLGDIRIASTDEKSYDRHICTIYGRQADGTMLDVNREMVSRGQAIWYSHFSTRTDYKEAEQKAKNKRLGIWQGGSMEEPYHYRCRMKENVAYFFSSQPKYPAEHSLAERFVKMKYISASDCEFLKLHSGHICDIADGIRSGSLNVGTAFKAVDRLREEYLASADGFSGVSGKLCGIIKENRFLPMSVLASKIGSVLVDEHISGKARDGYLRFAYGHFRRNQADIGSFDEFAAKCRGSQVREASAVRQPVNEGGIGLS